MFFTPKRNLIKCMYEISWQVCIWAMVFTWPFKPFSLLVFFFKTKEKHSKEMLKNNLQQHNIYETKFKSLRINFITDTSLFYMISLWNFQPFDDAIHTKWTFSGHFCHFKHHLRWNISNTCNCTDNWVDMFSLCSCLHFQHVKLVQINGHCC